MEIFGNEIRRSDYKKALREKKRFEKKFEYDPEASFPLHTEKNEILAPFLGIENVVSGEGNLDIKQKNGVIVGTIRMGFGHYRIAMAAASAAKSMGITPYWFDLLSFNDTPGAKIIAYKESLYNLGSRLSQKSKLFNKLYWEKITAEGFKKLSFNAADIETCSLMAQVFNEVPDGVPVVGTHCWPSLAALHAGMKRVVNMIPDNWPLALHLAEGAIHTVQTPSSYLGYRTLKNMDPKREVLNPIPASDIYMTGHYIDHELVSNIETDCKNRIRRVEKKEPRRVLISIGGAGAQGQVVTEIIQRLKDQLKNEEVVLFINAGDHRTVFDMIINELHKAGVNAAVHEEWKETADFAKKALKGTIKGTHLFYNEDIFAAVYATNLLMRASDVLVTKPSELAFYPIPKLLIQRVGGHEAWGAITSSEIGDGTIECESVALTLQALDLLLHEDDLLTMYCEHIVLQNKIGTYDGAYRVMELAFEGKKSRRKKTAAKKSTSTKKKAKK